MAGSKRETKTPRQTRRMRVVGASAPVRLVQPEARLMPKKSARQITGKRATIDIAAPRITINPWRTARDWRASRPKFLAAVLIVALWFALYEMFNADIFFVSDLTVKGNRIVTRDETGRVAGIRGWNIFFVEPDAVVANVRTLPEFKQAQVYVDLPNLVEVFVTERNPRFVWEAGGKNYWVDDDGVAMRPRGMIANGWQVRDAEGAAVKYGERVNTDAFNAVASLINAWKQAPRYFEWTRAHGLTLRDQHGWLVYFGSANQMADKLTALQIVTSQLMKDKRQVTFIDLGSGLPYYQEVAAAPATTADQKTKTAVDGNH